MKSSYLLCYSYSTKFKICSTRLPHNIKRVGKANVFDVPGGLKASSGLLFEKEPQRPQSCREFRTQSIAATLMNILPIKKIYLLTILQDGISIFNVIKIQTYSFFYTQTIKVQSNIQDESDINQFLYPSSYPLNLPICK